MGFKNWADQCPGCGSREIVDGICQHCRSRVRTVAETVQPSRGHASRVEVEVEERVADDFALADAADDALYDEAVEIVLSDRRASISYVQRKLRIGYNRAARLLERMERAGFVTTMGSDGSRRVLVASPRTTRSDTKTDASFERETPIVPSAPVTPAAAPAPSDRRALIVLWVAAIVAVAFVSNHFVSKRSDASTVSVSPIVGAPQNARATLPMPPQEPARPRTPIHVDDVDLPRLALGDAYGSVRDRMSAAGWQGVEAADADRCAGGDERCAGRPEMSTCSGTGLAYCQFVWEKGGKTIVLQTAGETRDNTLEGAKLQPDLAVPRVELDGVFAVQVAAYADAEKARHFRDLLGDNGLRAYTEAVTTPDGRRTRLRLGPFPTRGQADEALDRLRTMKVDGTVVSTSGASSPSPR